MIDMPENLRPGDYGLVTREPGTWLDHVGQRLIEWGTESPYCHAFVYAGDGIIIEAARRVRAAPVTRYDDVIWSSGRLPAGLEPSPLQRGGIAAAARGYVGERYNFLDIVAIGLAQARLGREVTGKEWWVKRLSDDHMQICSQLVVNAYRAAGINMFPGRLSGLVSPGDLGKLLEPEAVPGN